MAGTRTARDSPARRAEHDGGGGAGEFGESDTTALDAGLKALNGCYIASSRRRCELAQKRHRGANDTSGYATHSESA